MNVFFFEPAEEHIGSLKGYVRKTGKSEGCTPLCCNQTIVAQIESTGEVFNHNVYLKIDVISQMQCLHRGACLKSIFKGPKCVIKYQNG